MKTWVAGLADVTGVVLFAAIGRASHAEAAPVLGVAQTAWPFLAGAVAGALVTRYRRSPTGLPTGVGVWVGAVAGGMLLRALTGAGVQLSFVVVASIALGVLLLGWRAVYAAVARAALTSGSDGSSARRNPP